MSHSYSTTAGNNGFFPVGPPPEPRNLDGGQPWRMLLRPRTATSISGNGASDPTRRSIPFGAGLKKNR